MRAGWVVSVIGHIGLVLMTLLVWDTRSVVLPSGGSTVPVEIVDVGPESNVRALAREAPEEDSATEQEQLPQEPQEAAAPAPTGTRARNDDFSLDAVTGLINRENTPGPRRQEGERADRNRAGAGLGTAEVASLSDRVRAVGRAHLRRCWRMPSDLPEPDRLIVTVEFELNRNGTLNGQPRVTNPRNYTFDPYMRAAAEAALRAVRQCDPFPFPDDPVLGEHYELWREPRIVFDPSHF